MAAVSWNAKSTIIRGKLLQLICPATIEREGITSFLAPALSNGRNLLHYQVHVLVNGVADSTVQAILASSVSCAVEFLTCG